METGGNCSQKSMKNQKHRLLSLNMVIYITVLRLFFQGKPRAGKELRIQKRFSKNTISQGFKEEI
jgi:hypothetical protein